MNFIQRDLQHIWHPCSQMKDYEDFKPLLIRQAKGSWIELQSGQKILDAISSWWCKSLGHNHPRLKHALKIQLERFEQVILANTCQGVLVELSEKLTSLNPHLDKVFYASDGSSAIEIALKMSLHAQQIQGNSNRKQFMAFKNGYHGETCLALALSDIGLYRKPYESLFPVFPNNAVFLKSIPYVNSTSDPLWHDCSSVWPSIEEELNPYTESLSAIIFEPVIQGAGGMRLYSQDFLKKLRIWTQKHQIHLIADEIMTGLGRTGYPLACHHANISPDFVCLSKGLTGGFLPMSAVLTTRSIYDFFYNDYETGNSFLHSHTFSGNALAAAVALETLTVLEEHHLYHRVQSLQPRLHELMLEVFNKTGCLTHIRGIGGIIAADLISTKNKSSTRWGYEIFQEAARLGAFLRPLGNTLYWLPPFTIELDELQFLKDITIQAIKSTLK